MWENYKNSTAQRVKLLDAFMGFLVVVGGLQFAYCVVGGNYVSSFFGGGGELCIPVLFFPISFVLFSVQPYTFSMKRVFFGAQLRERRMRKGNTDTIRGLTKDPYGTAP